MTIDERIERHEALTQSIELMHSDWQERSNEIISMNRLGIMAVVDVRMEKVYGSHPVYHRVAFLFTALRQAVTAARQQDAENIRALARVAGIHEGGLSDLET
jgi:hypothetical protein